MGRQTNKKIILEVKAFKVSEFDIEFSSGKKGTYNAVDLGDSAMIVPILPNGDVLLIKEYFYAIDETQISLPKGSVEKGMIALETANKELQEEVGFKAGKLDKLASFTIAPGYIILTTHVFLARDLMESKLQGDEDEEIELFPTPFEKIDELIKSGQITEARVIAALHLAEKFLSNEKKPRGN